MKTKKKRDDYTIKPYLRVIGDVHGKLGRYVELAKEADYSIQVGDCYTTGAGDAYSYLVHNLDSQRHRIIAGNHDNYTENAEGKFALQSAHFLGDYGCYTVPGFGNIFFVRGGDSIDKVIRVYGVNWWDKEQLDYPTLQKVIEFYKRTRPDFVITHECPKSVVPHFQTNGSFDRKGLSPSRTAEALDQMFAWEYHKPRRWIFGHHHQDKIMEIHGTLFQCLAELSYVDFARNKENNE